ncbi:TetR/AcrR family transcriptional regulator [Sulfitobacter noctilucae]|uniref:TetR/AcrR family transcriptional regulator n=1 Tax=Sulfitobacter noctilucae TaxID=1342302 RepID=UPI0013779D9A|nr:TetR/AcrR family transcriptional regulator [Sulfitobacter noctilucae]
MTKVAKSKPRTTSVAQQKRNKETRLAIIHSAGQLVGLKGYAGCSIAKVTELANISHGAFYLHFKNQQKLFDVLLPELGMEMVAHISTAVRGAETLEEVERRGITSNIAYLVRHPHIYRVMYEAPQHAPAAYKRHHEFLVRGYLRSFRRILGDTMPDARQIEAIASMMMGARSFLFMRFCEEDSGLRALQPELIDNYVTFVVAGMHACLGLEA